MRRVTAVSRAIVLATMLGTSPAATGGGGSAAPRITTVFTVPSGSARQRNAIDRNIESLIAATPPGALIRIAIFRIGSPGFARTLVAARRRGVRIRLVVDASTTASAAYRQIAAALGTARWRSSWVVACRHGCVGDKVMHDKFFLFSRTGSARDVIVQSSANLTPTDRRNAWNNAVILRDARIYRAYGRYFSALAARRHATGRVTRSGDVTLYTFPRAGHADTLDELLGHVGCAGGTSVHVATFAFTRTTIARRLRSLAHQGCDVRVVYTDLGARARALLTGTHLLRARYRYPDPRTGRPVNAYVHSKYVTIDGTYAGRPRRIVITGSPNITLPALRHNDEAMLKIEDAGVHAAYERNFAALWRTASP